MTGKEKLRKAMAHEDVEVPIDFGSNAVTGIHVSIVEKLREYYGLEWKPVKVNEPYQMLGEVGEELKQILGIDVDGLYPYHTIFGFPNRNWKEWETPWGQLVLVPEDFNVRQEGEDVVIYPQGDAGVPPSGKMPSASFYFDSIIRQHPIDDRALNPEDNLEEFVPITDRELEYYRREAQSLSGSDRAVMANFGGTGLGDIALVPAPFLKNPKGIRDITEWYISTVTRQDYLREVFSRQIDVAIENYKKIYSVVGETVQVVFLCGTDFGSQTSAFCSPETFDSLYAPYYRRMTDWIHQNTGWKVFKHSCGAVVQFMEHFIEVGFDIINPVQCSAAGMDPRHLKDTYGGRITFWGGGVDTQKTLPFGTPAQVREEVLRRCEIFSRAGGFVFNGIHNLQAKTPVANIVAMIDAVHEFKERK
jgi:hypothetical protein